MVLTNHFSLPQVAGAIFAHAPSTSLHIERELMAMFSGDWTLGLLALWTKQLGALIGHIAAAICTETGLTPATSAPGLGSPLPHLHRDWARRCRS